MLGLGMNLVRGGASLLTYIKDGLKLFFPFTDNAPTHLLAGSTVFDGSDDYVNLGQDSTLNLVPNTDEFTISFWTKINSGDTGSFISRGTSGSRQYHIYQSSSADELSVISGGTLIATGYAIDDGEWHFISMVNYDDGTRNCYRLAIE